MYSSTGLWPGNSSGLSVRQLSSATFTSESAPSRLKYRPDPRRKVITCNPNNIGFANVFTYPETRNSPFLRSPVCFAPPQEALSPSHVTAVTAFIGYLSNHVATARNLGSCIFDKSGKIRGPFWKHALKHIPWYEIF